MYQRESRVLGSSRNRGGGSASRSRRKKRSRKQAAAEETVEDIKAAEVMQDKDKERERDRDAEMRNHRVTNHSMGFSSFRRREAGEEEEDDDDSTEGFKKRMKSSIGKINVSIDDYRKRQRRNADEIHNVKDRLDFLIGDADKLSRQRLANDEMQRLLQEERKRHDAALDAQQDAYERKLKKLLAKLNDAKRRFQDLQGENEQLGEDMKSREEQHASIARKLRALRKDYDDIVKNYDKAREELEIQRAIRDSEIDSWKQKNEALLRSIPGSTNEKEEWRIWYGDKLKEAIRERDALWANRKEHIDQEFAKDLQELKASLGRRCQDLQEERGETLGKLDTLARRYSEVSQERDECLQDLAKEKKERSRLEYELVSDRKTQSDRYSSLQQERDKIHDAFKRLAKDYNHMQLRNAELNSEIETLERRCSEMEEHIADGCRRPFKRRRLNHVSQSPIQSTLSTHTRRDSSSIAPNEDVRTPVLEMRPREGRRSSPLPDVAEQVAEQVEWLDTLPPFRNCEDFPLQLRTCQFSGEWRGFELENAWDCTIVLHRWFLRNYDASLHLELPTRPIKSGEVLRVCFDKKLRSNDLLWEIPEGFVQRQSEPELIVSDSKGHSLLLDRVPKDIFEQTPERRRRASDCFIM